MINSHVRTDKPKRKGGLSVYHLFLELLSLPGTDQFIMAQRKSILSACVTKEVSYSEKQDAVCVFTSATSCSVLLHVTHTLSWVPSRRQQAGSQPFLGECIIRSVCSSMVPHLRRQTLSSCLSSFSLEVPLVHPMPLSWHRWQKSNLDDDKIHKLSHQMCRSRSIFLILNSFFGIWLLPN